MQYDEFCLRFFRQLKDTPTEKWPAIFRGFCLDGESTVRWPVAIFQPLNFQDLKDVDYLTGDSVVDDRVRLSFEVTVENQEKLERTEIIEREPEQTFERPLEERR